MALSYVWLLIKPSHLSPCVLHSSITHLSASCLCLSLTLHHSHSLAVTHTQTDTHIPLRKSLHSGESSGFHQGLFDIVIRSETQLAGPSLAAASATLRISIPMLCIWCASYLTHLQYRIHISLPHLLRVSV